jgi:hypothetical protein
MRQKLKVRDKAEAQLEANTLVKVPFKIGGIFDVECYDREDNLKWKESAHNLVVNVGLNHALDVIFHGDTPTNPWYVGLKGAGSPAAGDTLASHGAWSELFIYDTNLRQEYVENAASSQSIDNVGNVASFAISGSGTVAGALLAEDASGTSGVLFCAADFASARGVADGDTLNVTYTVTTADDGV